MHSTDISAVKHLFMFFRQIYTLAGEKYADYKKRNLFFSVSLFYKINFSLYKINLYPCHSSLYVDFSHIFLFLDHEFHTTSYISAKTMKRTYHLCLSAGNENMLRDEADYIHGVNCLCLAAIKTATAKTDSTIPVTRRCLFQTALSKWIRIKPQRPFTKAHPHLSEGSRLLISYNTNVWNGNNTPYCYHPRFIWLDLETV